MYIRSSTLEAEPVSPGEALSGKLSGKLSFATNIAAAPMSAMFVCLVFGVNFEFVASAFGFTPKLIRKGLAI